jgi:terminal uridylyltransferase
MLSHYTLSSIVHLAGFGPQSLINTRLLACYNEIEPRFRKLGLMIKTMAKLCEMNDASNSTVSSYAWIMMMIHFLQRSAQRADGTEAPPVLPYLQQLESDECPKREIIVEGHDVYFFDRTEDIGKVWPGYQKNTESLGTLWLQFLKYYTEEFDFEKV